MARKGLFIFITLFWLTMNGLLWRAEFSGKEIGAATPVSLVWEKILTSPDDSGLAVMNGKDRVGYIRWSPNIGEENATGKTANENSDIEGRIKKTLGYTLHSDGNFLLPGSGRLRFDFDAKFTDAHQWTEWKFRGSQRPNSWGIAMNRDAQSIELTLGEGKQALTQAFKFSDFQNPGKLLEEVGAAGQLPMLAAILPQLQSMSPPSGTNTNALARLSLGLKWEAQQDWLQMGHSRVKVYRLRAHLLDKYEAVVIVSRVGEILRVELPGEIALINEALINL
jgi:hypothetical protein